MKRTRTKCNKLIALSCDRMCDGGAWGTKDHKLLVDTLDALNERIREINSKLFEVAGMAHMDVAINAARYADKLRDERRELHRMRDVSTKTNRESWELKQSLQGELFSPGAP